MKKQKELWAHAYPLLLFAMIILSLLFLVAAGTGLYSALVEEQTRGRQTRAALSYLAARVHAADTAGSVSIGAGPEGDALLLREKAGEESYETRIYLYDGALREEYVPADWPMRPESAERIAQLERFALTQERPGLLKAVTEYGEAHIALRCGGEAEPDA